MLLDLYAIGAKDHEHAFFQNQFLTSILDYEEELWNK